MGKVLVGVIALFASMMLVDSLTCRKCSFTLTSFCAYFYSTETCQTNTSVCANTVTTFPLLSSFGGFAVSGCLANNSVCGTGNTFSLVSNISYSTSINCCSSSNNCNAVNAAPSTKMTLGAAVSVAALASLLGRML